MTPLVPNAYHVKITYHFEFENGDKKSFGVDEDLASKEVKHYSESRYPWADLKFKKCDNCPLADKDYPHCPATLSLVDIIEYFSKHESYSTCLCKVEFPEKTIVVQKSIQEALYPLMGLRLATSQCPVLGKLKYMARFHEPFAGPYYTVYRATSGYLLGQYFAQQKTGEQHLSLDGLKQIYADVQHVNKQIAERLVEAKVMDATPNSIVILSMFSTSMTYLFDQYLELLEKLYL